jgi:hypothetical protein
MPKLAKKTIMPEFYSSTDVLKHVVKHNKKADRAVMRDQFLSAIIPDRIRSSLTEREYSLIVQCVVDQFNRSVGHYLKATPVNIKAKRRAVAKINPLEEIMTNGKMLMDCTGSEVRRMAEDAKTRHIYLSKIADVVGSRQKVGNVLDESQLLELMKDAARRA